MNNQFEKALNYLRDAVTVKLPIDEIVRRAKLLVESYDHETMIDNVQHDKIVERQ